MIVKHEFKLQDRHLYFRVSVTDAYVSSSIKRIG